MMIASVLLGLYLCLWVKLCLLIHRQVNRYRQITLLHTPQVNALFPASIRKDSFKINKAKMYLAALFLLPIRTVLLLAGLLIGVCSYWLVSKMPYGRFRQLFLQVTGYLSGRLLFHSQGYHWISQVNRHPSHFLPTYPKDAV